MPNTLILCGGTGAHAGVAFLRLHTLGHALGFFDQGGKPFEFPAIFLVDQDSGDGNEREPTAWQLANSLIFQHPGRFDWFASTGSREVPELIKVTPLPIGPNQQWFKPPHNTLALRFDGSPLLPVLASSRQRQIDYSKGMMGSPSIGSLLFKLKEYDERGRELNQDETFGQLLKQAGRIVVAGSGVGGTGASVGPTLAQRLAERNGNQVMAVMVLDWFVFDEEENDQDKREKAQLRNRIMRENANSALEFYGQSLAQSVATLPVGVPEANFAVRRYTSDVGQPLFESYIHAVAALGGLRHYLNDRPFGPGLYAMGAVERGRLTGDTAIPGGTLQDLANQAATVLDLLETYRRVLATPQRGKVVPAIYEEVDKLVEPALVADPLGREIANYRQQLAWMSETLSIQGVPNLEFTREAASRQRLGEDRKNLSIAQEEDPERIALALFHWVSGWVRDEASPTNGLQRPPGEVHGGQWPDLRNESISISVRKNGDLTRVPDQNISVVLEAFVDHDRVSSNGWPHPLAAADYFRHSLERGDRNRASDRIALRQLELLMVGLVSGTFELRKLNVEPSGSALSLENLSAEYRRRGFEGLAEYALVDTRRNLVIGFNSPITLLCPVPYMGDADDYRLWQEVWVELSGTNDGAPWTEAQSPSSWGNNDLVVRQIRSWIEHQKRSRQGGSPPWTRMFEGYPGAATAVPFGAGALVKVYWGSANAPERPLVEISLPTRDVGVWVPPAGTPDLSEAELLALVPSLASLEQEGVRTFWQVDFEMPDGTARVRGWWDEHLNHLVREGRIHVWSRTEANALVVGVIRNGILHATKFADSQVLSRKAVEITSCTPFVQDPVDPAVKGQGVRYPDIPIKAAYLDLVLLPNGRRLTEALKSGTDFSGGGWSPAVGKDDRGRHAMKWNVRLDGRSTPMPIEIRLEEEPSHRAHWMVWPRFRTPTGAGWKAYYIYEHCTNVNLFCDVVWLESRGVQDGAKLHRRTTDGRGPGPFPVSYRNSPEGSSHNGGPPLALVPRNVATNEEEGLYLVPLQVRPDSPVDLRVAIDFGTSHSVAAYRTADDPPQQVGFTPELENAEQSLSLHISEDRSHLHAPEKEFGLLASGAWLPTYRLLKGQHDGSPKGILPTELLTARKLRQAQAENVSDWQPARDFTIPPLDVGRSDLAEYLLTDFKWDTGSAYFRGKERDLREHYLNLFLELTMAEIVDRSLRGFPSRSVQLTFTYPLRSTSNQVGAFRESIASLVRRGSRSLGIPLALKDDIGIFDESRAARVTSNVPGEVCLVADLGGGTLDLFIAANNQGGKPLAEVADSAKLGGNLLLRQIAQNPAGYLPEGGNWKQGDPRETETRLRSWMRSNGSAALFGARADGRPAAAQMGLSGFDKASEAARARLLLSRYFRLIVDYLARNLVAYLTGEWFPKVEEKYHDTLRISIQLRGNGWRLRYQDEGYVQATQAIRNDVRQRVQELWQQIPDNPYPLPADDLWEDASRYSVKDPKAEPVKQVVGKAMSYDEIKLRWYSHTLVDLEVLRGNGSRSQVGWYSRVPFPTGGSSSVVLKDLRPPVVLSSPSEDRRIEIRGLDASLQGRVNHALQNESVVDSEGYLAPVAPLVWEAVFESQEFMPEKGER
jgi:hypothetical protein